MPTLPTTAPIVVGVDLAARPDEAVYLRESRRPDGSYCFERIYPTADELRSMTLGDCDPSMGTPPPPNPLLAPPPLPWRCNHPRCRHPATCEGTHMLTNAEATERERERRDRERALWPPLFPLNESTR